MPPAWRASLRHYWPSNNAYLHGLAALFTQCLMCYAAVSARYPHLKQQGRCVVHKREAPEGEEDTFEWTEEEMEEGPEQLAVLEADTEVDGGPAWSAVFSSSNDQVKNQVRATSRGQPVRIVSP